MKTQRTKKAQWFECKVRHPKTTEDGMRKTVTEQYVVEATSFGDAEDRISEAMLQGIQRDETIEVLAVKIASYKEVVFSDMDAYDKWFRAKVSFLHLDEQTGKEKKSSVTYLLNAANVNIAVRNIDDLMGDTCDYEQSHITETKIVEVLELSIPKDKQS